METKLVKLDRNNLKQEDFKEAAEILNQGGLVAFPTETVYGLGGNALDPCASRKIYAAKGRPSDNPLIIHIAEKEDILKLAEDIPESAWKLADSFWPGPMTMILKKKAVVPKETTGGLDTVAIRLPSDEIARMLIKTSGVFIAAPSANASGRPSPTKASHVYEDLNGRIEMILDGGSSEIGLESSIIDVTGSEPLILRPGFITQDAFSKVLGSASYDKAVIAKQMDPSVVAKAPGMKYRHYAPKGEITIVEGEALKVSDFINSAVNEAKKEGRLVAVMCCSENRHLYEHDLVFDLGSREHDGAEIAQRLFDRLRNLDTEGIDVIYSESFENMRLSPAIMNRLRKAAGYRIKQV